MEGSGRRPDLVGAAFGAFLVLAVLAVAVRVRRRHPPGAPAALGELVPPLAGGAAAQERAGGDAEHVSLGGPGLAHPLPPLYYDGPREVVPPAAHEPGALAIPELGVESPLLRLDKRPDGRMQVPGDFSLAGWYVRGPAPGQTGPAVIAGHLDSRRGPAVFARLGELAEGDEILVRRGDGHVVRFTVSRVASYPKDAFPTEEVYGNTEGPELRLITCDGDFDRRSRSYAENLVVYAVADPATLPSDPGTPAPADTPSPAPPTGTPSPEGPAGTPSPESPGPAASPSTSPREDETGLPTEDPTPSPRPSGGVRLP